jgi:FMN-dependent oxidoreductase (nitrilotriacetate monooxygenase family)
MPKQMSLAAYFNPTGHHVASWRHPRAQKDANVSIQHYVEMAQAAERAKFDMLFLADGSAVREAHIDAISRSVQFVAHFEPMTLLSALSMVTKNIGLTATVNTTYEEPYNLARKFASLDIISGGRAGWNLVTSSSRGDIGNFGRDRALNHQERYGRAREFVQVVRGLWDSWDDDAFVRDVESGLYFHPESMHYLDHVGQHFKSRGPLNVPRPVQGYPVQVQAGASDEGRDLAAEFAEAIFSPHLNIPEAKAYYDDVKGRMQSKFNRDPDHLKILPGLSVVVAESDDKAAEDFELLQSLIHPIVGREILATMLGNMDLSAYSLDEPLPDPLPATNGSKGHYESIVSMARRENLTIRQLGARCAGARGKNSIHGSPKKVADYMEEWFANKACDGFCVLPPYMPGQHTDFCDMVVPELQKRGIFRKEYAGPTLRENLGIPRPESRYKKQQRQAAE